VDHGRRHPANVGESRDKVRRIIESLVAKRDARRDGFVRVIRRAMQSTLGTDAEEVLQQLTARGFSRAVIQAALRSAERQGRVTIFALVDALTRAAGTLMFAGGRLLADQQAASLLSLAA